MFIQIGSLFLMLSLALPSWGEPSREQLLAAKQEAQRRIYVLQNFDSLKELTLRGQEPHFLNQGQAESYEIDARLKGLKKTWAALTRQLPADAPATCRNFVESSKFILQELALISGDRRRWQGQDPDVEFLIQLRLEVLSHFVSQMIFLVQSRAEAGYSLLLRTPTPCFSEEQRPQALTITSELFVQVQALVQLHNGLEGLEQSGRMAQTLSHKKERLQRRQKVAQVFRIGAQGIASMVLTEFIVAGVVLKVVGSATQSVLALRGSALAARGVIGSGLVAHNFRKHQQQRAAHANIDELWAIFSKAPLLVTSHAMKMDLQFAEDLLRARAQQQQELLQATLMDLETQKNWAARYGGPREAIQHLEQKIQSFEQSL